MSEYYKLTRIPSLKTVNAFQQHAESLGLDIPCEDKIAREDSPIGLPLQGLTINGKIIGNRVAVHPMEGWDGTASGGVTDLMRRRWQRFGESGAKLICGGEAMAVRPDGRANSSQLIINEANQAGLAGLRDVLLNAHQEKFGNTEDLVIGFQLTHSGRFCRPEGKLNFEPKIAYRHPILDGKFGVQGDENILSDEEVEILIADFVKAARVAVEVGADFVDIKHCHGYLLHEFLGAYTREGRYGGSFENRTRILREIVEGIRADGNGIDLAVRLSTFDMVPFRPDPDKSQPGKPGPGIPEEHETPFPYQFGVNHEDPTKIDIQETFALMKLCGELGIKLLNTSAGVPYYTPHLQRPAAYPPSDGYQSAYDPLIDLARQINVVRDLKSQLPKGMAIIASGLSYLQDYLPHVCQALLREDWTDMVGLGRMVLSYPDILNDAMNKGELKKRFICRTFSDCTTAPRKGLPSGCFPLDDFYSRSATAKELKARKKAGN